MILDTNALSAVADDDGAAIQRFHAAPAIAVPVVVLGEFRYGIAQSRHRAEYERWLEQLILRTAVLEIENETSIYYAQIRAELKSAGKPIPANDAWIAALCRQHSFPLLSNDRHFDHVKGLHRISWA